MPHRLIAVVLMSAVATSARAQDWRTRLEARGLPADLIEQIATVAAEATAQGLPAMPLADKAIEGYAKQVPAPRIVSVVRQYGARMLEARAAVQGAGVSAPEGGLITAATDAMGRGLEPTQVGALVRAARQSDLAAPGLTVAAALTAQGMPTQVATDVVTTAMQNGSSAAQILDLPSAAQALQSGGMTPDAAGRELLRGGRGPRPGADRPGPGGPGRDGRPGVDRPGGTMPPPQRPGRPSGPGSGRPGTDGVRPPRP